MLTIHIKKPTASQLNRSSKGCGIRITEGDIPIMVKKELVNKIRNKFKNGKAHTLYSHEMEGGGFGDIYKQGKEYVKNELKQKSRQLKKEARLIAKEAKQQAIQAGRELKKEAIRQGNEFISDVAKPYLTEMVQTGIVGLGTALAVVQPELAPFIGVGTLALSSMAGNYIDEFGNKRPKPLKTSTSYVSPIDYQEQQPIMGGEDYINPTQVARTRMNDSVDDLQRSSNLIGFGLGRTHKVGSGLFAGGRLVTLDGYAHPALESTNPNLLLNRNLLPAYIQNQQFLK
jgi:hypothetical protein